MLSKFTQFFTKLFVGFILLVLLLAGCTASQVSAENQAGSTFAQQRLLSAENRIFLPLSLEFLDRYQLPALTFQDTPVGGLSALAYSRQQDRFYALSDDPSAFAPARFYQLRLVLNASNPNQVRIETVEVEEVVTLKDETGQPYPRNSINAEGLAITGDQVFIASEGITRLNIPPFISQYDLKTGQWIQSLPIPERYLPSTTDTPAGIQNNLGFESLTVSPVRVGEPFRLFTATESPLEQDRQPAEEEPQENRNRLLHYLISDGPPLVISEHLYPMDTGPRWSISNGLTELLAIDPGGHFLSLERSLGFLGYGARIFQISTGGATDTSGIPTLKGSLSKIEPVRKKLLLDLSTLGFPLDNLEGMTLGPRLPDGTQSLILVSDNNFDETQVTQFLLFRLKKDN